MPWPSWARIACRTSGAAVVEEARPDPGTPERGRPHLLPVAARCAIPSFRLPMSCTRKSEYGKKSTSLSAATALGPVVMSGRWQLAQPIDDRNIPLPAPAVGRESCGGGARNVVWSASCITVAVVSLGLVSAGFAASRRRCLPGGSHSGKTGS